MTQLEETLHIEYLAHMLDEAMLTEGKHWPEDYKKTAFNSIKSSELGKQNWYTDNFIQQDIDTIASDFTPLAHRNSNLGYFAAVIRWFIQYSETSMQKYQEFIEQKLDTVIQYLQLFVNDTSLVEKYRDAVKQQFTYEQFIDLMKPIADKAKQDANSAEFEVVDKGYEIIPIMSYKELHKQFGGRRTGYNGQSEWCHTNGSSTYSSWTSNYTKFFFILAKKNWKKILPPDPEKTNAYDKYGTSLMAILVSDKGELLNCTLRWNHVIDPAVTMHGRTVDKAFISFAELSQVTGLDVKAEVDAALPKLIEKFKNLPKGRLVYKDTRCKCYATDKLTWYNVRNKVIQPPEKISGVFNCGYTELTSLARSPREVNCFYCNNAKLTSLAGAPRVATTFDCSGNELKDLVGGPEEVEYYICGMDNWQEETHPNTVQLTSFIGAPKRVDSFTCRGAAFNTLDVDGMPDITYDVTIIGWPNLTNLEGIRCSHTINIQFCNSLTSFAGCPETITGNFNSSHNKSITSLEGCPKKIGGDFYVTASSIHDFQGGPTSVGREVYLGLADELKSLKGAPGKCRTFDVNAYVSDEQVNAYMKWKREFGTEDNSYPG